MSIDQPTIKTYNESAKQFSDYFEGIGSRVDDIEWGIKLAKAGKNARVVEIGCGDGRDAVEIIKRVGWYEGFDPSSELLSIAKRRCPDTSFILADALSYEYPKNIDVVFAFASLLHVSKVDFEEVITKVADSLRIGGIIYISLKERERYQEAMKVDEYGERMFYYYNVDIINSITKDLFKLVYEDHQKIGKTQWLTVAFEKLD